ncbi:hypothetical protein MHYP_G00042860 [Metynnis hypsauchen]
MGLQQVAHQALCDPASARRNQRASSLVWWQDHLVDLQGPTTSADLQQCSTTWEKSPLVSKARRRTQLVYSTALDLFSPRQQTKGNFQQRRASLSLPGGSVEQRRGLTFGITDRNDRAGGYNSFKCALSRASWPPLRPSLASLPHRALHPTDAASLPSTAPLRGSTFSAPVPAMIR